MPTDAHSILLDMSNHKYYEEMDVGAVIELTLGQRTAALTISGLFDSHQIMNGHGSLAMDTAVLFAPEELFLELYPEIKNFDYFWSIVSNPVKAEQAEEAVSD